MKQSMSEYINSMIDGDMDTLEQIISLQYRKFTHFYRLVKEYSEIISEIKYEFNSPSSLDVVLCMNTRKSLQKIKNELESSIDESKYTGNISVNKKNIFVSIVLDEK